MDKKRVSNIVACTLITGGGQGFLNNTLNIYIQPVSESLGILRSEFSVYSTIIMLTTVSMAPIYARLYGRKNLKSIMILSMILCVLATFGFSISTQAWHFYVFAIMFGLGFNGVNLTVAANIITQWFDKRKGLATGIAFAGSGFFASAMVAVLGEVIEQYGWRVSYRVAGISGTIVLLIAILVFLKTNPTQDDLIGNDNEFEVGKTSETLIKGYAYKDAIKTPMFYSLLIGGFLLSTAVQCGIINMTPAFVDAGHQYDLVTKAASVTLLVLGFAKIFIGRFNDFCGMVPSLIIFASCTGSSFIFLLFPTTQFSLFVTAVLIGIGAGGFQVTLGLFVRDIFGNRDFAKIFAIFNMFQLMGTATGAIVPSVVYDTTGSYIIMWQLLIGLTILSVALYYNAYKISKKTTYENIL
ncbi:hypothetical protein AN639_04570 [Candidatus Epulonipiscium fishelsonii]|uniref:Uncharacterized protein n=1 Tax=Candidatus Epulonipiscium fishelsonii TaxID=77094 RepID=A0ACC8XFD1_9FIRM|nr:hypothetical protein AN639_04570 [Epulopiscium sp. SCG-B05WGA-EpuloA1]ONI41933.1 hypothetical protein AN396_02735 [Epulopiscium sp. SCG-B11WGA-EpuloA1]